MYALHEIICNRALMTVLRNEELTVDRSPTQRMITRTNIRAFTTGCTVTCVKSIAMHTTIAAMIYQRIYATR